MLHSSTPCRNPAPKRPPPSAKPGQHATKPVPHLSQTPKPPLPPPLPTAGANIGVLAKIESADSVGHLEEILDAVDGAMVARGDLGAELPVEEVPFWQNMIVQVRVGGCSCWCWRR